MWPNPLFTFTEEILNGKLHFLCSIICINLKECSLNFTNWDITFLSIFTFKTQVKTLRFSKYKSIYLEIILLSILKQEINWLCVIIMSPASFRVNLHSIDCQNVKKLLVPSRRYIWSLSDSNGIRTHNHLVGNRALNHLAKLVGLAKWLSVALRNKSL